MGGPWEELDGERYVRRLAFDAWRVVEGQHLISTRKLVDSDEEQRLLEELLEKSKPPLAADTKRLHYLLATPFRYPPLRHGSRFGSRFERGIWYGAKQLRTALAEVAYYRLLFLEGTHAKIPRLSQDLTAFRVALRTPRGVDLTRPPFAELAARLASKTSYATTQRLGRDLRAARVGAFCYSSARDPERGTAVAVLDPAAFAQTKPRGLETWHSVATRSEVEVSRRDFFRREVFRFERRGFLVRGHLPRPAI
ncbi:MAG: RES family NAD+ phosphorylase [Polyangiaceae bacterium]|nr:RES family NAD+ phosphorylase [Polyangiaceae bacterium]